MQEPRMLPSQEVPHPKSGKKKASTKLAPPSALKNGEKRKVVSAGSAKSKKTSKRDPITEASHPFHNTDGSASESLPDSSSYGSDYRELRHKYLVLEEESFSLDREMSLIQSEVKALEDEKFGLLDQLVVMEGLIDPSELKSKKGCK